MKKLVKLSNVVALVSIVLLIYWLFAFIVVQAFELRVFRETISGMFGMSVFGIIALMTGSLIINIMYNLTRIAESRDGVETQADSALSRKWLVMILLSFPLIGGLLYSGDYLSAKQKEKTLIASAQSVVEKYPERIDQLANYRLDNEWLNGAYDFVEVLSATDKNFPSVDVIVKDSVFGRDAYLRGNSFKDRAGDPPEVRDLILPTTAVERAFLDNVFNGDRVEPLFLSDKGKYDLFFPVVRNGKKLVLRFSDYERYGKLGSP